MGWSSRTVIAFVTFPILTICAASYYYFYHKRDKRWQEYMNKLDIVVSEIKIPIEDIGPIIGRGGSNVKEIQDRTQTKIFFDNIEGNNNFKICRIRGYSKNIIEAEKSINELLAARASNKTFSMWLLEKHVGWVIGRCGDTVSSITKNSGAKINISRNKESSGKRYVTIQGTDEQIEKAKMLILKKISELDSRQKEGRHVPDKEKELYGEKVIPTPPSHERLDGITEGIFPVYVPSVADPLNFWIQLLSPQSVELDNLGENMSDYYGRQENLEEHKLREVKKGDIVATKGEHDDRWYRVKVFEILKNYEKPEDTKVDVFFCDYGNSDYIELNKLYSIKPSFLELKFQAIEATLFGIQPRSRSNIWDQKAIDAFEDMVFVGQWKSIMAEVVHYKRNLNTNTGDLEVPVLRLYYPPSKEVPEGKEIAMKMIEDGFALPADEPDSASVSKVPVSGDSSPSADHISPSKGKISDNEKFDRINGFHLEEKIGTSSGSNLLESRDMEED